MSKKPRKSKEPMGVWDLLGQTDTDEAQTHPLRRHPELTLRDEANAITVQVFRNGFLENLHAGRWSPVLSDPAFSRITNEEMKKLMIETSARLAHWLYLRELLLDEQPDAYFQIVSTIRWTFTKEWERRARTCELPAARQAPSLLCSKCQAALHDAWRFCPLCGTAAGHPSP